MARCHIPAAAVRAINHCRKNATFHVSVAFFFPTRNRIKQKLRKDLAVPLQPLGGHVDVFAGHGRVAVPQKLLGGNQIIVRLDVVVCAPRLPQRVNTFLNAGLQEEGFDDSKQPGSVQVPALLRTEQG